MATSPTRPAKKTRPPQVLFRSFSGVFRSWRSVQKEAAEFAGTKGDRLINITQAAIGADAIVTVWYWRGRPKA